MGGAKVCFIMQQSRNYTHSRRYPSYSMQPMHAVHFISGCILISLAVKYGGSQVCSYQYNRQPGILNESCNLQGFFGTLQLRCQVTGPQDTGFEIRWHHSMYPPTMNISTSEDSTIKLPLMSGSLYNISTNCLKSSESDSECSSIVSLLILNIINDHDYRKISGFYWCSVRANSSSRSDKTGNPSQVVNVSETCFSAGNQTNANKCPGMSIMLHESVAAPSRFADCNESIDIVNAWDPCLTEDDTVTPYDSPKTTSNESKNSPSTDKVIIIETDRATTTTNQQVSDLDDSTITPTDGSSMQFVWISVGIVFAFLVAIITVLLVIIFCLNHRKNKFKVSSNPAYAEQNDPADSLKRENFVSTSGALTDDESNQQEYETLMNVIHVQNPTFDGERSPDSNTSLRTTTASQMPLTSLREYEVVSNVTATRDSIRASQRNQYETIENEGPLEYSHLQHSHGGSLKRKISTNSTGSGTLSASINRERLSKSSSLTGCKPEPLFDSPEYMSVGRGGPKQTNSPQVEVDVNIDTLGYSHINHESLQGKQAVEMDNFDSDVYTQVPRVFMEATSKLSTHPSNCQISSEGPTAMAVHPLAHRQHSATVNNTSSDAPYTTIDRTCVEERNMYSFSIVSTDEQYISEQGHVYHVLERSDEHQQKITAVGNSKSGSPKFRIQNASNKDKNVGSTIPPYGQVTKSPKEVQSRQKELEITTDCLSEHNSALQLQDPSEVANNGSQKISLYSQVDKSKKTTNMKPKVEEDEPQNGNAHHYHILEEWDSPDTHHYHVLEHSTDEKIEAHSEEEEGPIYHIIDH